MVSRYTHQGYGQMFEHMDGEPVQPGDEIYYAEDDYQSLAAELAEALTLQQRWYEAEAEFHGKLMARVAALEAENAKLKSMMRGQTFVTDTPRIEIEVSGGGGWGDSGRETGTKPGNCLGCGAPLVERVLPSGNSAWRCSNPTQPCCA